MTFNINEDNEGFYVTEDNEDLGFFHSLKSAEIFKKQLEIDDNE